MTNTNKMVSLIPTEFIEQEAEIIINGIKLSKGMSITIRVALGNFESDLRRNGLGNDSNGKRMTGAYLDNVNKIQQIISK